MSFSPDRPRPDSPLPPEVKAKLLRRIAKDLQSTIEPYEHFYTSPDELASIQATSFTRQRFSGFQAWITQLSEQTSVPASWKLNQKELEEAVSKVEALYQALLDVITNKPLSAELSAQYSERSLVPEEFLLDKKDLPPWTELPSEADLKTGFAFDWIWVTEYKQGRKLEEFTSKEQDLLNVNYAEEDADKRKEFLRSVDPDHLPETLPPARIFDLTETIARKKEEVPGHPDYLTTQELLEAFEAEGVRPATLIELLVYSKKYWKPKADPNKPLTEEEKVQRADAPYVYAVGSVFSDAYGSRLVPCLDWRGGQRRLYAYGFGGRWSSSNHFLVFGKASS